MSLFMTFNEVWFVEKLKFPFNCGMSVQELKFATFSTSFQSKYIYLFSHTQYAIGPFHVIGSYYTPCKHEKIRGIERDQWHAMV